MESGRIFMAAAVYSATCSTWKRLSGRELQTPTKLSRHWKGMFLTICSPTRLYPPRRSSAGGKSAAGAGQKPNEIKEDYDYFEIVGTVSAEEAFGKPGQFGCKMK